MNKTLGVIGVGAFLLFLIVTRLIVWIGLAVPAILGLVVVIGAGVLIATSMGTRSIDINGRGLLGGIVSMGLFVVWVIVVGWGYRDGLVTYYVQPQITTQRPEVLPRVTAFEIAQKTLGGEVGNDSTTQIGDVDPIYNPRTNSIDWYTPKEPSAALNPLTQQVEEIIVLSDDGETRRIKEVFRYGEGMYFFDNIGWHNMWSRYFSFVPNNDVFYWELPSANDQPGETVIVAPLVRYRLHWLSIVPVWDGALVVWPNGHTEHLSVSQAESDLRFAGAQMYPASLLLKQVENTCYRFGGLGNCWFSKQNVFEVPNFEYSDNAQPYYALRSFTTADGEILYEPVWVVTADPRGERNQSIVRLFIQDTNSRAWAIVDVSKAGTLVGPDQAIDIVRNKISAYTWVTDQGDGTQIILEPRPAIQNGVYYWVGSITTRDYTETAALVVVNADTREVYTFCSGEALYAWFAGSGVTNAVPCDGNASGPVQETAPVVETTIIVESGDYQNMDDSDLLRELGLILQELQRRGLIAPLEEVEETEN